MAEISQGDLERFFAEIAPRLETAQTLDDELDRQLARRFNVFRYLRTDEKGFSRMIADLLDPSGVHGQGTAFLKLLTDKLDFAQDVTPSDLSNAKVQMERRIDGGRRIDIVVEIDSQHCLAIENKSNSAVDKEDQVEDYLGWLKREYDYSLLVYLSPAGDGPSETSMGRETIEDLETSTPRRFAIMPCGSKQRLDLDDGFDKLRLESSLVNWFADCRKNCDVDRLRWYLREVEMYCRQRYGGNVVTNTAKGAVEDFLRRHQEHFATALAVYETWPKLSREIRSNFLEMIMNMIWEDLAALFDEDAEPYIVWDHGPKSHGSYISIYCNTWRPYVVGGQDKITRVQMIAESAEDADWYYGVWSPAINEVSNDDRERRSKLQQELRNHQMRQHRRLPCWEYVDERYRDWNPLIPKLHEEVAAHGGCDGEVKGNGGEIANILVKRFKEFAVQTIPIIKSIDGS